MPFAGNHTAVRLASKVDAVIQGVEGLSLDKPMTVVHDAAANMKASMRYTKVSSSLESFICMDHRLQTILKKAFEGNPELKALMDKARNISSRCHQSALTCETIKAECEAVECTYVKVIKPCPTRWNSNWMMVESLNTLKPALESLLQKVN